MRGPPDLPLGQQGKKSLDLVQPGASGWRQVHMPAWAFGQPVPDQRGFVRCIGVRDRMHIQPGRHVELDLA